MYNPFDILEFLLEEKLNAHDPSVAGKAAAMLEDVRAMKPKMPPRVAKLPHAEQEHSEPKQVEPKPAEKPVEHPAAPVKTADPAPAAPLADPPK